MINLERCYLFALTLSVVSSVSVAQDLDRLIPIITPPAPDVSSLGKFGDIPVGTYTGVPNISIPIYQIQVRDISLPISINYHASGIQVKEEASWIGLGWNLSAGGAVTRSIRGLDDLEGQGFYNNRINLPRDPEDHPLQSPQAPLFYWSHNVGNELYMYNEAGQAQNYYSTLTNSTTDWASDIYYFNCGNLSGKFLIDRNGNLRSVDHQDIKIEITKKLNVNGQETAALAGWKITTADGTQYFFGNRDYSPQNTVFDVYYQRSSTRTLEKNVGPGFAQALTNLHNGQESPITAWSIKKIVSPLGEEITFEYEKPALPDDAIYPIPDYSHYFIEAGSGVCWPPGYVSTDGIVSISYTVHQSHYLTQINFKNGYIKFNRSPVKRLDLSGADRLASITIHQKSSTTGDERLIRTFEFKNDSYFNSTETSNDNYNSYLPGLGGYINDLEACNSKRLRLDELVEFNGSISRSHQFFYNDIALPRKTSYQIDHWGFYNGAPGNNNLVSGVQWSENTLYYHPPSQQDATPVILNGAQYNGANRVPDGAKSKAALIQKIIYPTKGWTEFSFESNQYVEGNTTKDGGGVRVAKIIDFDPIANRSLTKVYKYNGGKLVSPVRNFMINFCNYAVEALCGGTFCEGPNGGWYTQLFPMLYRYSYPIYPMSNAAGGSLVGYDQVEIWYGDNFENGKTVFEYHNGADVAVPVDQQGFMYWPGIPGVPDLQNGNLLTQIDYAKDTNRPTGLRKVKSTENSYVDLSSSWANKTKYLWNIYSDIKESSLPGNPNVFLWMYPVPTAWNHLESTVDRIFDENETELLSETKYTFHNAPPDQTKHHQLLSKLVVDSDGTAINSLYSYPADYNPSAMNGTIANLLSTFKMNRIIEERSVDAEINGKTVSGLVSEYNDNGQPVQIFATENTNPVSGVSTNPSNIVPDNTLFKQRALISYDEDNNMSSQRKINDMPVSYLWGYGRSLPIAEVKNAEPNLPPIILTQPFERNTTTTGEIADYEQMGSVFDVEVQQTVFFERQTEIISGTSPNAIIEIKLATEDNDNGIYMTTSSNFSLTLAPGRYRLFHKSSITWGGGPGSGDLLIRINFSLNSSVQRLSIFHTSFEDDSENISAHFKTGNRSHVGPFTILKPSSNGKHILIYWSKPVSSSTESDWTYHRDVIEVGSNTQNITIGNNETAIDEVRVFPQGAQMTTYTYDPLIGVTSITDANDQTTYYEYDGLGRLLLIRNEKREIERQFAYQYKD